MTENRYFLPFALPLIGEHEIAEVIDTLRSGWLTTGPKTRSFEAAFSTYVGARHALAVNSATAGLHLALEAIGIGEGDRVVTTPYTFTATAEVIRYLGADPVFVDIDPETFNIEPELIGQALAADPEIKAIIPVHFAGQSCDMDSILALAREYGLRIVEDAAHAIPANYKGQLIGAIGDITVFSFYGTKTITTGEGGMVTTSDDGVAERIRTMRLHGINRDVFDRYSSRKPSWYYEVVAPGFKYNMPDIAAALGIHQLIKAHTFRDRREKIARMFDKAFADLPLRTPRVARPEDLHAWHLYVIQLELENLSIDRDRFIELMAEAGIGTSVHFIPLHIHPYWRDRYNLQPEDFPVSYSVFKRAVSLPIYPRMSDEDIDRVIEAVRLILMKYGK
jgi:dTDP-4-amino-4,6-dideoxygalactose transaminase